MKAMMADWSKEAQDYRRGWIEGYEADRDAYLLRTGARSLSEYERGYRDGQEQREIERRAIDSP